MDIFRTGFLYYIEFIQENIRLADASAPPR